MADDCLESGVPNWVMAILPADGIPRRLKANELKRAQAWLDHPVYETTPTHRGREAVRSYLTQRKRVQNLLKTCIMLSAGVTPAEAKNAGPPKSIEEAQQRGFVAEQVVLETLTDFFRTRSTLNVFLNKYKDRVSTWKPRANRKMVHAAELLVMVFEIKRQGELAEIDNHLREERTRKSLRNSRK